MLLKKWNYNTREYDPFEVSDALNVKAFSEDMAEIVNCASCGRKLFFGDTYCSLEIHTKAGFGYGVCEDCNMHEWQRKRAAMKNEKEIST